VKQRKEAKSQMMAQQQAMAEERQRAEIREILTEALKNVAQAQVNTAKADKNSIEAALAMISNEKE
jgi:hypothetical protein